MRGDDGQTGAMFSYLSLEERVPADHPLRAMRQMAVNAEMQAFCRPSNFPSDSSIVSFVRIDQHDFAISGDDADDIGARDAPVRGTSEKFPHDCHNGGAASSRTEHVERA